MKLVLNRSAGARLAMSAAAIHRLFELKGSAGLFGTADRQSHKTNPLHNLPRNDKDLVQVVEELGIHASDHDAELIVIEIPDNVSWSISDIVGYEYVKIDGERYQP